MAYKEKGAGGERLNAGDLNELINNYKMKAHASFSNKIYDLPNISTSPLMINCQSSTVHFLFESIERKSYLDSGEAMPLFESWDLGGVIPSDIQDIDIRVVEDNTIATHTIRNRDDNISTPYKVATKQMNGFYLEYWYTYTMLTLDISVQDPNAYYAIIDILDSVSSSITGLENTSLRVSYGNINVITSPNAVQNKNLDSNFTNVLGAAFENNTNLVFQAGSSGKKEWQIRVDNIFIEQKINYFKLIVRNDNATISGITILGYAVASPTGLTELDHNIIALTSGKYIHELTYSFQPALNEFGYQEGALPFNYWPAYLQGSGTYVYSGSVIILPNSKNEFGYGYPVSLDDIDDDTPLTNILLSYMSDILDFSIYKYGPQNYMAIANNDGNVSFFNTSGISQGYNDGAINTHLTIAGAYYQLLDMLNFNDGQEISWNIQYIK